MIRIKQTKNLELVNALQLALFPSDQVLITNNVTWFVATNANDIAIAFAGVEYWDAPNDNAGFLCRCGVHEDYRGMSLQRRLIKARERDAIRKNKTCTITYTVQDNYESISSLIKSGYRFFEPEYPWSGEDVFYFIKYI